MSNPADEVKTLEEKDSFPIPDAGSSADNEIADAEVSLNFARAAATLAQDELQDKRDFRREDQQFRRILHARIWNLTYIYLSFVALVIIVQGGLGLHFLWFKIGWHLSDNVLMTLLGSTTVTIVGLFATVARYYFQSRDGKDEKKGDGK